MYLNYLNLAQFIELVKGADFWCDTYLLLLSGGSRSLTVYEGSLPDGLAIDSWRITGTPSKAGNYTFTLKAENEYGSDSKQFTINVVEPEAPVIINDALPEATVGQYFNYESAVYESAAGHDTFYEPGFSGGRVETTVSIIDGKLPDGLALNYNDYNSSYRIEGTPKASGEYTFTLKASNIAG